jgi:hypothetical protein
MDEDVANCNEAPLDLSEVPPDDISRLDELVLNVVGASRAQFDVE